MPYRPLFIDDREPCASSIVVEVLVLVKLIFFLLVQFLILVVVQTGGFAYRFGTIAVIIVVIFLGMASPFRNRSGDSRGAGPRGVAT